MKGPVKTSTNLHPLSCSPEPVSLMTNLPAPLRLILFVANTNTSFGTASLELADRAGRTLRHCTQENLVTLQTQPLSSVNMGSSDMISFFIDRRALLFCSWRLCSLCPTCIGTHSGAHWSRCPTAAVPDCPYLTDASAPPCIRGQVPAPGGPHEGRGVRGGTHEEVSPGDACLSRGRTGTPMIPQARPPSGRVRGQHTCIQHSTLYLIHHRAHSIVQHSSDLVSSAKYQTPLLTSFSHLRHSPDLVLLTSALSLCLYPALCPTSYMSH